MGLALKSVTQNPSGYVISLFKNFQKSHLRVLRIVFLHIANDFLHVANDLSTNWQTINFKYFVFFLHKNDKVWI
jgi:hypothetical protein